LVLPGSPRGVNVWPQPALRNRPLSLPAASGDKNQWLPELQACLDDLTLILEQNSENAAARFLRALARGQLAAKRPIAARSLRGRGHQAQAAADEDRAAVDRYHQMTQDIDELLGRQLTDRDAILHLLDGVVRTKLAGYAGGTRAERASARNDLLQHAESAFGRYLHPPLQSGLRVPTGFNRFRAEFFRGVVVYRQALMPAEREGRPRNLPIVPSLSKRASSWTRWSTRSPKCMSES